MEAHEDEDEDEIRFLEDAEDIARREEEVRAKKLAAKERMHATKLAQSMPRDVMELVYVTRSTLVTWVKSNTKDFADRVKGCLVKVALPKDGERGYYLGVVISAFDLRKQYKVEGMMATKGLIVKHQGKSSPVRLQMLSNTELEEREFGEYLLSISNGPSTGAKAQPGTNPRTLEKERLMTKYEELKQMLMRSWATMELGKVKQLQNSLPPSLPPSITA